MTKYYLLTGHRCALHVTHTGMDEMESRWTMIDLIRDHIELVHKSSEESFHEAMEELKKKQYRIWYCPDCFWAIGRESYDAPET